MYDPSSPGDVEGSYILEASGDEGSLQHGTLPTRPIACDAIFVLIVFRRSPNNSPKQAGHKQTKVVLQTAGAARIEAAQVWAETWNKGRSSVWSHNFMSNITFGAGAKNGDRECAGNKGRGGHKLRFYLRIVFYSITIMFVFFFLAQCFSPHDSRHRRRSSESLGAYPPPQPRRLII